MRLTHYDFFRVPVFASAFFLIFYKRTKNAHTQCQSVTVTNAAVPDAMIMVGVLLTAEILIRLWLNAPLKQMTQERGRQVVSFLFTLTKLDTTTTEQH